MRKSGITFALIFSLGIVAVLAQNPDILVADFEGANFGAWTVTGTAFGSGPAHGALLNQMNVDGFQGHGLVNSYHGGDGTLYMPVAKALSPENQRLAFSCHGGDAKIVSLTVYELKTSWQWSAP